MAIGVIFKHPCVILDACCIINLYASENIEDVLEAIPKDVMVAAYVYEEEIIRYDLKPIVEKGLLSIAEIESEEEEITFVNYAAAIGDDGEAATGAIAFHRQWAIATDDKRAINVFLAEVPVLQLISTPDLIKHWVEVKTPTPEVVRAALSNIRIEGHYAPPRNHPLLQWWNDMKREP